MSGYTTCPECGKTTFASYDNDKVGLFKACIDKTCKANWRDTRQKLLDARANQGGIAC